MGHEANYCNVCKTTFNWKYDALGTCGNSHCINEMMMRQEASIQKEERLKEIEKDEQHKLENALWESEHGAPA